MCKLEKLLVELCPEGVDYVELQEAFILKNGYTPSKSNDKFWKDGNIPWFRMEDIRKNGRILSDALQHITSAGVKGNLFPVNSIIMATTATIGEHALITVESLANQQFTYLTRKDEYINLIDPLFAHYVCFKLDDWCAKNTNISNIASVDMKKLRKFRFPVPPLPVQQEIVRILDNFTELTARKKQYEYYRDLLLNSTIPNARVLGEKRRELLLGSVAQITSGKNKKKLEVGNYPVYGSTGVIGYTDKPVYSGIRLLVARVGANCGYIQQVDGNYDVSDNTLIITLADQINYRYMYHLLTCMRLNQYAKGGGQPLLTAGQLKAFEISIPSFEEQIRITEILDRFDSLCNDLTSGLPAEIEARRKQYEYYRDKLLTFKEAK